jgi:leucyl/phenylalanyl-tRNA--protein transferase
MPADAFPDPLTYDYPKWVEIGGWLFRADDVVAFGIPLTPENVREAYLKGIFPWYTEGVPLPWHCPKQRSILPFQELTVPRSLEQARKKSRLTFTIDRDFAAVIRECSRAYRPGQRGTWITPEFESVYVELHHEAFAHSVEAWNDEGELVGGLYGVDAGGLFCGESMFFKEPNASKLALLHLIDHLEGRGSTFLDAQVITPHMRSLGARLVPRDEFLYMLSHTQEQDLRLFE